MEGIKQFTKRFEAAQRELEELRTWADDHDGDGWSEGIGRALEILAEVWREQQTEAAQPAGSV